MGRSKLMDLDSGGESYNNYNLVYNKTLDLFQHYTISQLITKYLIVLQVQRTIEIKTD